MRRIPFYFPHDGSVSSFEPPTVASSFVNLLSWLCLFFDFGSLYQVFLGTIRFISHFSFRLFSSPADFSLMNHSSRTIFLSCSPSWLFFFLFQYKTKFSWISLLCFPFRLFYIAQLHFPHDKSRFLFDLFFHSLGSSLPSFWHVR